MSANRKLQFLSLAEEKEAQALESLLDSQSGSLVFKDIDHCIPSIVNAIVLASKEKRKLGLVMNKQTHQLLAHYLKNHGFEFDLFKISDHRNEEVVRARLDSDISATPNIDGLWNQMYNVSDLWTYHQEGLSRIGLLEKTVEENLAQFYELDKDGLSKVLFRHIDPINYDFEPNEFAFLRGRLKTGTLLYKKGFSSLEGLTQLHPVFFDMYSKDEAYIVIYEVVRKLGDQVKRLKNTLEQELQRYRRAQLQNMNKTCAELREKLIHLRQGVVEEIRRKSQSEQKVSWTGFFKNSGQQEEHGKELLAAYRKICEWLAQCGYPGLLEDQPMSELTSLEHVLNEYLGAYSAVRRLFKRALDRHFHKLNRHTVRTEDMSTSMKELHLEIREMIEEVNGYQIFRDHWQDHSLDVEQQNLLLHNLQRRIELVQEELPQLKDYISWQHFRADIGEKGKPIMKLLAALPVDQWLPSFDAWYLRHYLECQDIHTDGKTSLDRWNTLFRTLKNKTVDHLAGALSNQRHENLNTAISGNKSFKKWWNKGTNYPELHNDLEALICKETCLIFEENQKETMRIFDPEWIIFVSYDDRLEVKGWLAEKTQLHLKIAQGQRGAIDHTLRVEPQVLYSSHSDRIDAIHDLSELLFHSEWTFELFQNQHEVVFTMVSPTWAEHIHRHYGKSFHHLSGSNYELQEQWTEALLNNASRRFTLFYSDLPEDKIRPHFPFTKSRLLELLSQAGFDLHYISWSDARASVNIVRSVFGTEKKHISGLGLAGGTASAERGSIH